jgi:hypothetical protein
VGAIAAFPRKAPYDWVCRNVSQGLEAGIAGALCCVRCARSNAGALETIQVGLSCRRVRSSRKARGNPNIARRKLRAAQTVATVALINRTAIALNVAKYRSASKNRFMCLPLNTAGPDGNLNFFLAGFFS